MCKEFKTTKSRIMTIKTLDRSKNSTTSKLYPYIIKAHVLIEININAILIIILLLASYSHQHWLMVFHWSLNDKSSQVSRTLLSILTDVNNEVIWMVSTSPLISKSSSPFINRLVTVPGAPISIGIIITFMFHSFFNP